jgi:hypothetical protein
LIDAVIYLVPLGAGRFELYSEPPDDEPPSGARPEGFFRSRIHRLQDLWREAVHTSRQRDRSGGRFARARDWAVSSIVEMVAEQRTLWSLRDAASATLVYPSDFAARQELAERDRILVHARRHHGMWLLLDGALFAGSGVFVLVPGPNVLAYYFAVRVVGHYLCWRGAGQALTRTRWETRPEPALAELGSLVNIPRDARAPRVAEIAIDLKLPRLAAFFDRAAVPAR